MELRSLRDEDLDLVAGWLAEKENYQWLDFGDGLQKLTALHLKVMTQRRSNLIHVFSIAPEKTPIGLVAFCQLNWDFLVGTLWYLLGEKKFRNRGFTSKAVSRFLEQGFHQHNLRSVHAWVVAHNQASVRVLEKNHFSYIGRQRQCHRIDGRWYDRLHFDLLAEEFQPLP